MESRNNPYWYKLLKLLKAKNIITTGLTIPYIMGTYEILGHPFQNIDQLVKRFVEDETDKYPVIQKCIEIRHDVLMVEEKHICNRWSNDIAFRSQSGKNKLFISTTTNLGSKLDVVCSRLNVLYGNQIRDKVFSWNQKQKRWMEFSIQEKSLILAIDC